MPVTLVLIPSTMLQPANLAIRRRLRVVDSMFHRLHRTQVGKYGFQILVGDVFELRIRHDGAQLSSAYITCAQYLDEQRLIVVADTGGIGRYIRRGRGDSPQRHRPSPAEL